MNKNLHAKVCVVCCFLLATTIVNAQVPVVNSATPNNNTIARFDKFELTIGLTASYVNAYDYDEIAVKCTFTTPGGKQDVVDGFYMQNFTLAGNGFATATGTGSFKIRYAPAETGTYTYVVSCTNAQGTGSLPAQTFQSVPSGSAGFIRKNATNYLAFDDGSQYIPIGENMGWQSNSVTANYTTWLNSLAGNGGNFIRVWMSSWAFALEWKNGSNGYEGLKKYKQSNAYYLDWLLDYCKQKNVYIMLALNNHGQVSTNVNPEWTDNPYNAVNGGPATNTWDFFTNATAKNLHKNRLRYILARYGYSQQIQSWELFNELHWTDQFATRKNDLTAWDDEMSTYIKSKDVNNHLVTTSYGGTEVSTNTWSLPNIDFTQTHFYINSPNIETVLSPANQSYLTQYSKPTLNGEFGLGPSGSTLSTDDPNGIHIHNAIWATTFSGGMGSAMTWWWDDYIAPKNLYYHYAPLSSFISKIKFKDDNYKKATATATGTGGADVMITPGAGYGLAPASAFTIDASGTLSPGAASLGQYVFGSTFNTQNRNPPTFTVNYPVAGQFKVVTASVSGSASPRVTLYLDGAQVLNSIATASTTYSINIPAGPHTIKVDNLGVDWIQVSNYVFTNIGSPISAYVLKATANNKAAGYVLNNKYNWQYLKANGNAAPPAVAGGQVAVTGMANGNYTVFFFDPLTNSETSNAPATVAAGTLTITLPSVSWDVAFRAFENSTLPIRLSSFKGEKAGSKNRLFIDIATAENVRTIFLERSANTTEFKTLAAVSTRWSSIGGKHEYVDELPLSGPNYYRLKIIDNDGRQTFSGIVQLVNDNIRFTVQPNPFTNLILLHLPAGKFKVRLVDVSGKGLINVTANSAAAQDVTLRAGALKAGVYYAVVYDSEGKVVGTQKIIK